jgi:hypothetical protein
MSEPRLGLADRVDLAGQPPRGVGVVEQVGVVGAGRRRGGDHGGGERGGAREHHGGSHQCSCAIIRWATVK